VNTWFHVGRVNSDGTGEGAMATGYETPFGVGLSPAWVNGTTLMMNEAVNLFEYMTFNTALAPFTRVVANGNDAAFTLELTIPGGMGGGWNALSRTVGANQRVLWRHSTSGGGGTQEVRSALLSSLTGQNTNAVGTVLLSMFHASSQFLLDGFALTPDGLQMVISLPNGSGRDLYVYSSTAANTLIRQLTFTGPGGLVNGFPSVSPDGTKVLFHRCIVVECDIFMLSLDGTGALTQITDTGASEAYPTWSPDGTEIAFSRSDLGESANIYAMRLSPDPTADLEVHQSESADPAPLNQPHVYTIAVSNPGAGVATDVALVDILPSGVTLNSAVPTQGSCTQVVPVVCSLGSIGAGGQASVAVSVTPTVAGTRSNVAMASTSAFDPDAADNRNEEATVFGNVASGPPKIAAVITGKRFVAPGVLSVDLLLTNKGSGNALNVTLGAIQFRTLTGVGAVTMTSPALPIAIGNVNAGVSATVTLTLDVPPTVRRFAMSEAGAMEGVTGKKYKVSLAQSVIP
jgi:uncharacterized repeat protein (TIGR01451 family)